MRMRDGIAFLLVAGLMITAGCLTFDHHTTQSFNQNGQSDLHIDMLLGLGSDSIQQFETMSSKPGQGAMSSDVIRAMTEATFLSSSQALCDLASGVDRCTVDESTGWIALDAKLDNGTAYTITTQKNDTQGKEYSTYTIRSVPTIGYYAGKGMDPQEYAQALQNRTNMHLKTNLESRLQSVLAQDFYCSGNPFNCAVSSSDDNSTSLNFTLPTLDAADGNISSALDRIKWIGCGMMNGTNLSALDEARMKLAVKKRQDLNAMVKANGLVVKIACPNGTKSLVMASENSNISKGHMSLVSAYQIKSKEETIADLQTQLASGQSSSSANPISSTTDPAKQVLDLQSGTVMGSTYEKYINSTSMGLMRINLSFIYTAHFPQDIISARIGTHELSANGRVVVIDLKDLVNDGPGALVVVTSKDIPKLVIADSKNSKTNNNDTLFGLPTMVVVGGGIVALILIAGAAVMMGRPKGPAQAKDADPGAESDADRGAQAELDPSKYAQPPPGVPSSPPTASGDEDGMPTEENTPESGTPPASGGPIFPPHPPSGGA